MTTLNVNITMEQFIMMFQRFPKQEQKKIATQISELTFAEQWKEMDKNLPDAELSEEEIMQEVLAVRYGKN
jgi:hypothetical protein